MGTAGDRGECCGSFGGTRGRLVERNREEEKDDHVRKRMHPKT